MIGCYILGAVKCPVCHILEKPGSSFNCFPARNPVLVSACITEPSKGKALLQHQLAYHRLPAMQGEGSFLHPHLCQRGTKGFCINHFLSKSLGNELMLQFQHNLHIQTQLNQTCLDVAHLWFKAYKMLAAYCVDLAMFPFPHKHM